MLNRDEQGVLHLRGELSIHDLESLRQALMDLLYADEDMVLSLGETTFMDTAVLQLLLAFRNSLPPDRNFQVVGVSEKAEQLLCLSGLRMALLGQGN
jgi:anti-anti-sigma factor